jgi:hypothetical protein
MLFCRKALDHFWRPHEQGATATSEQPLSTAEAEDGRFA